MDVFYEMPKNRYPITLDEMEAEKKRINIGELYTFSKNEGKEENTNFPKKITGVITGIYSHFFTVEYTFRGNSFTECISFVDAVLYRRGINPFATW